MSFFGIDIGSYAIKFIQTEGTGDNAKIKKVGSVYNPVGQITPDDPHQLDTLASAIKSGITEFGLSGLTCHVGLPSQLAYISIVNMPVLSDAELASAIKWEAEQHIPVSLAEVNFEYDVIYRPPRNSSDDSMTVFMVGAPKNVIDKLITLLESSGVEAMGLEPEVLSLIRTYFPEKMDANPPATLICNFGALSTSFVIIDKGYIQIAHSANVGSLALTRAIEKGLSLDPSHSEEYKRTYGLDATKLEGKVQQVLTPVFDGVVREIRKTIQFYVSKSPGVNMVSRVIICGGGANLPGLSPYLVEALSVEVSVGNPFGRFEADKKIQLPQDLTSYSVAVGLAIKDF